MLVSLLQGKARLAVEYPTCKEDVYSDAVDFLNKRFGNEEL